MTRGALILCGGRSTRMGRDKASLPFGGQTLLQRIVQRLRPCVDEVLVVAHEGQALPPLPPDVHVLRDEVAEQGPLGGLLTGLRMARSEALYATGCDAPFLAPALVELLFRRLGGAQIAVADEGGFLHPLAAVYRRDVLAHVEALLAAERRRPLFLYERVETVRVPADDLRTVDPELLSLANLNTPEAYREALARFEAEGAP